jgi:cytochrome c556
MRKLVTVAAWLVCASVVGAAVQGKPAKPIRSPLMKQKLDHAQKVLEGLATKNFDLLEKSATELILISRKAEWRAVQSPEYERLSEEFRRNADTIARQARGKNIDGAAMGYVRMTLNCVDCHNHIRESKIGMLDRK